MNVELKRHQELMAAKEKSPEAKSDPNPSVEKSGSKIASSEEIQRSSTEVTNPPARGLQPRPETGVLKLPEMAIPLRSAEFHTPYKGTGSSGHYSPQKNDSPRRS